MSDTVVTDGRAESSGPANQPAPSGFRWIGPMSALQAVMEEQGLDGGAIIAEAGIAPGALQQPEDFIGITVLGNLLARCAEVASCPHLGVALGLGRALRRSASSDRSCVGATRSATLSARWRTISKSSIAARSFIWRRPTMPSC